MDGISETCEDGGVSVVIFIRLGYPWDLNIVGGVLCIFIGILWIHYILYLLEAALGQPVGHKRWDIKY